uniref:Uncharacterized protein n=1 Tax=Oryza brachyantha TaxID=4533 RepID=J3LG82_ORYBR
SDGYSNNNKNGTTYVAYSPPLRLQGIEKNKWKSSHSKHKPRIESMRACMRTVLGFSINNIVHIKSIFNGNEIDLKTLMKTGPISFIGRD